PCSRPPTSNHQEQIASIKPSASNRQGSLDMVTTIVLINTDHGHINDVAEKLVELDGVSEVYSVGGRYDLVAVIRVRTNEEMADLVTRQMLQLEHIAKTETLIAFKAYSQHDLERMFSLGMDEA